MAKNKSKNIKGKEEVAREMNAKDISWKLFKETNDLNYYRLYSALKDKDKK